MKKAWFELLTSGLILLVIVVLLDTLLTTAHAAVDCAQAPPIHHRKHVPPVACTVASPPRILWAEPELNPIQVYVRYELIGMCFQEVPTLTGATPITEPAPVEPPAWLIPIGFGGGYIIGATLPPPVTPVVTLPRTVIPWIPPKHTAPTAAPELSSDGLAGALTLLAGIVAVTRGRKGVAQ